MVIKINMEKKRKINAFIQARMSSSRFPGKVLAPLSGKPVLAHVVERVSEEVNKDQIVVLTSTEESDNPLALYAVSLGVKVYRGSLDNVFERFQNCLNKHMCEWFFRVCADSPFIDPKLLKEMIYCAENKELDIITNVHPRTFSKGQSLELVYSNTFKKLDSSELHPSEREHITKIYYEHPEKFKILNIESKLNLSEESLAIDDLADIFRLEKYYGKK